MKSFLYMVILLSLLMLSITPEEVSGKTLTCHFLGLTSDYESECEGNDVVCVTVVRNDDGTAAFKSCGERNRAISVCEGEAKRYDGICKSCDTDLCNNEMAKYPEGQFGG